MRHVREPAHTDTKVTWQYHLFQCLP